MANLHTLSKSALKEMQRTRANIGTKRQKVVTDDILKLKSLTAIPTVATDKTNNYYVEPITIEYYIPKESRFAYEKKMLYIELIDPQPKNEEQIAIQKYFADKNEPIDVMEVMNVFPQHTLMILDHYTSFLNIFEALSREIKRGLQEEDYAAIKKVLYLNEVLRKFEPTIPALKILGDYTTLNINWCIRYLNLHGIEHSLEDRTVAYLIKLHKMKYEELNMELEERFLVLSEIYLEQAFPEEDDIFDEDF